MNEVNRGIYRTVLRIDHWRRWRRVGQWVALSLGLVFTWSLAPLIAADVAVSNTSSSILERHGNSGYASVFVDDAVGYKFYVGSDDTCYYASTTDSGATWSAGQQFNSLSDCGSISVWYDQWTPGSSGSNIHIVTLHPDASRDDIRYERLNTSNDTLLVGGTGAVLSDDHSIGISHAAAKPALTRATDGTLYVALADNSDAFIEACASNCQISSNWSEAGTSPLEEETGDLQVLAPLLDGDILLINRVRTDDDIRSKEWDSSTNSWDVSWIPLDVNAPESAVYEVAMSAVTEPDSGDVYLAYVADHNNFSTADHDIRTAVYSGGSWTQTSNVLTNDSRGITNLSTALDGNNDAVYVTYGARATIGVATSTDIYWASSTDAMSTWSNEAGPLNATSDDFYGIDTNYISDQRLYTSWVEAESGNVRGNTMADPTPPLTVSSIGAQVSELRGDSTNNYVGGAFTFQEFDSSRTVTNITIHENGSVNGANDIDNIRLLYEFDTTAPYDCASESYGGSELQFGATDTNGFNGPNGLATFVDSVDVATSSSLCVYVLLDITDSVADGQTLDIEMPDPSSDVVVSGSIDPAPSTLVELAGDTTVVLPRLRQTGYHWRNDDGTEADATSATGGAENTTLVDLPRSSERRLRLAVSNDGSTSTESTTYRLEYGVAAPTCADTSTWTDVAASDDAWNLYNSPNLNNGDDTTNIATSTGGVSDPNDTLLANNDAVLESTSQSAALTVTDSEFIEFEYALVASSTATQGETYCFRMTAGGEALTQYINYPSASIAADVELSSIGSHISEIEIGSTNVYAGGAFVIAESTNSRNVTSITLTETGTIEGDSDLANVALFYESDTSAPYDCSSETYTGSEPQFGSTVPAGFDAADGEASFSDSVSISTTSSLCVYVRYDVEPTAQNGEEIALEISNPNADIGVSGGASVAPSGAVALSGSTAVTGSIVTQVHYHWRNDDGSESGATSVTGGEDVALTGIDKNERYRLRLGLSNEGGTSSLPVRYTLQFGTKDTTCDVVASWTDVEAFDNDAWDLYNSTFVAHGSSTTNISVAAGGVSDEEAVFLSNNQGIRESDDTTATTTLDSNNFVDFEYTLGSTQNTPYETDYCFRLVENGSPLVAYDNYAQATTKANRDFKVQRGSGVVSGTEQTFTAGVDYDAPSATSSAFVRISNFYQTGAGNDGGGGNQNPDDVTAYITTSDLTSSFTIERDTDSLNNTFVAWEIIEYVGDPGADNEMQVHAADTLSLAVGQTQATSSAVPAVSQDENVVVFITGSRLTSNSRINNSNGRATAAWASSTNQAILTRVASNTTADFSYAVVEFSGANWDIQRVEHTFSAAGVTETESIAPVGALTKAFVEVQKRYGYSTLQASHGVQSWLSSMGVVSFLLDSNAEMGIPHVAVAWVIENTQNGAGEMVVFPASGLTSGGAAPATTSVTFDASGVNDTDNASVFGSATHDADNNGFPAAMGGLYLSSSTAFTIWRSDTGNSLSYRVSAVEWPAADVAIRQNYYRWYDNRNNLTPNDAWPPGGTDIGENTSITELDTPVGDGDVVRLRTSFAISNGSLPADLQTLKIQYGLQDTTCSAIGTWHDVGSPGSGSIWRGFDNGAVADDAAIGANPPTGGQTLLSVSDRAGRYVEDGSAAVNPYSISADEDVEYDWVLQHNGATQRSDYCFRVVQADGTELAEYLNYPVLRTEGYSPVQTDWRWYDDAASVTPSSSLAVENTAPTELAKGNTVKLRVLIDELNNLAQSDARFRLQYSDSPAFNTVNDVVNAGVCSSSDIWCYADGGGVDNAVIDSALLSNTDACAGGAGAGCGTHHESDLALTGYTHQELSATEFEFTMQYQLVSGYYGQVWHFRVYDVANDQVVPLAASSSYPSVAGESGSISFNVTGVPAGTTTEGVVTDASTTATSVPFGALSFSSYKSAAQRLTVDTNAVGGYQILQYIRQPMQTPNGDTLQPHANANATPGGWEAGCSGLASCFGYHAGDDTLSGTSGRFSADDSFAGATTTPAEIMYSAVPTQATNDIIYRIEVGETQPAGEYTTDLVYIAVPQF